MNMTISQLKNNTAFWCKFQAVDTPSNIIQIIQIAVELILFFFLLYSIHLRKKYEKRVPTSPIEVKLNSYVLIWNCLSLYRTTIGIMIYNFEPNPPLSIHQILYMSALYNALVATSAFFLNALLFAIPSVWIYNILDTIDPHTLGTSESFQLDKVYTVIKASRKYQQIRYIFLIMFVGCQIYMILDSTMGTYTALFQVVVVNIEACLILGIFTFGLICIKKFGHLIRISSLLIPQLKRQYIILVVCCLSRLLFNLLFFIAVIVQKNQSFNRLCKLDNDHQWYDPQYKILWYLNYIPGYYLTHCISIAAFLKFYWPNEENLFRSVGDESSQLLSLREREQTIYS